MTAVFLRAVKLPAAVVNKLPKAEIPCVSLPQSAYTGNFFYSPKLIEMALSTILIDEVSRLPIFSFNLVLSIVLTCSSKTIESFESPQPAASTFI